MGRPREHEVGALLDRARELLVEGGTAGLTVRALSARSGVSNGAIYNAFGSRDNVLANVWARETERFLACQRASVDLHLAKGSVQDAVVAAALAPAEYARTEEQGARLLLTITLDRLMASDLPPEPRARLRHLRLTVSQLIVDLSRRLWKRSDVAAITVMRYCVVDLPAALLLVPDRPTDPIACHALEASVRGVIAVKPPR